MPSQNLFEDDADSEKKDNANIKEDSINASINSIENSINRSSHALESSMDSNYSRKRKPSRIPKPTKKNTSTSFVEINESIHPTDAVESSGPLESSDGSNLIEDFHYIETSWSTPFVSDTSGQKLDTLHEVDDEDGNLEDRELIDESFEDLDESQIKIRHVASKHSNRSSSIHEGSSPGSSDNPSPRSFQSSVRPDTSQSSAPFTPLSYNESKGTNGPSFRGFNAFRSPVSGPYRLFLHCSMITMLSRPHPAP